MTAAIIPAQLAFAAEENEPVVYTYNFTNLALGEEYAVNNKGATQTYAVLIKNKEAVGSGNVWKNIYLNTYQKRAHDTGLTGNVRWKNDCFEKTDANKENLKKNLGWTFEITVPEKGTYLPTVAFDYAPLGGIISTRIISETKRAELGLALTDTDGDIDTVLEKVTVTDAHKKDTYKADSSGLKIDEELNHNLPAVELDAGKNYVIFLIDGACDAVIDANTNEDGYSMIEYDAADKQILEAGIIYGQNKNISLNSYVTKASVKNLKNHGQFIALPNTNSSLDQSVARGYIVYLDGSEYKVAYSD